MAVTLRYDIEQVGLAVFGALAVYLLVNLALVIWDDSISARVRKSLCKRLRAWSAGG